MSFSRPFAAVHTEDQWRRAAHQGTSLQPGTWAVQLAWSHGQPAPDQYPDEPPPTAAGLAFDPWCRLYRSLPDAGRVERLLPSGTASSPVPSFRQEDAADLFAAPLASPVGQFSPSSPPPPALASPRGLCVDAEGRLFVAEHGRARILVYDLADRRLLRAIALGPAHLGPRPLDLATDGERVWAILDAAPFLIELTARTGPKVLPLPPHVDGVPSRIAVDHDGGLHLLCDAGTADAAVVSLSLAYPTLPVPGASDIEFAPAAAPRAGEDPGEALVVARLPGADFFRFMVRPQGLDRLPDLKARGYDGHGVVRTPDGEIGFYTAKGFRRAVVARVRYVRSGRVVAFRLDAGAYQSQWGRVFLDACIPPDTAVRIHCVSADEPPDDPEIDRTPPDNTVVAALHRPDLSPPMPPASLVPGPDAAWQRLHRRDGGRELAWSERQDGHWATYEAPVLAAPGRFLWVFIELSGDTRATPRVRALRVEHDSHALLRRLPAVFSRDAEAGDFLRRYLALADGFLLDLELRALHRRALLDPDSAPADLLPWLASFVGLVLDERWPESTRRAAIAEATWLFRFRGTVAGLSRFIELYLGRAPIILEKFRLRGPGGGTLGGTAIVGAGLRVGGESSPDPSVIPPDAFATHAHRFSVIVPVALGPEQDAVVRRILDVHRPAHTLVELCTVAAGMRVGLGLHAGLTTLVGPSSGFTQLQIGSSALGRGAVVGRPGPGTRTGATRLGLDSRVA